MHAAPDTTAAIYDGLNAEQRVAVDAVRGPVVILAGAGTGKTTTITRRIAHQVHSGEFEARTILAVTFTTKASAELVQRLNALGAHGVQARTFHSAALRQVERLGETKVDVLESKVRILLPLRDRLPKEFRNRTVGDLASEIERAKNNRLTPETYLDAVGRGWSPVPTELMQRVFADYEAEKRRLRKYDFEDLLEQAIRIFETDDRASARFRAACRAITVDEYQDVNLLQQTLLDQWLGDRDDVCVVGDDYQAIFAFAGASPDYLIKMLDRFPNATRVTLESNYRSTPQILAAANRLAPQLGGVHKTLRSNAADGPEPVVERLESVPAETAAIVTGIKQLTAEGIRPGEIAILYRINARSIRFELALLEAGLPFQVARGGFLQRRAAKSMLSRISRGAHVTDVLGLVERLAVDAGYVETVGEDVVGLEEYTRQLDLAQLIELAREFDDGAKTAGEFINHLHELFGTYEDAATRDAVRLSTLHLAKGLEWDAVFMPAVAERELPFWRAIEAGSIDEERRLFYVGLTRARRHLRISFSGAQLPSSFLDEMYPKPAPAPAPARVRKFGRKPHGPSGRGRKHASTSVSSAPASVAVQPITDSDVKSVLASLPSAFGSSSAARIKNHRASQAWTNDEDRLLAYYRAKGMPEAEIADILGRRESSIGSRLRALDLP